MLGSTRNSSRCGWLSLLFAFAIAICILSRSQLANATYPERISTLPATYNYQWAPTKATALASADNGRVVVALPWSFPFYGERHSNITITTNGYILLGDRSTEAVETVGTKFDDNQPAPAKMIAPWWNDWTLARGGSIWYGTVGDVFIVEWWQVSHVWDTTGATYSFELKLFKNGTFQIHYKTAVDPTGASPVSGGKLGSVGYHESTDTAGENLNFMRAGLLNSMAIGRVHPGDHLVWARAIDTLGRDRADVAFDVTALCTFLDSTWHQTTRSVVTSAGWNRTRICDTFSIGLKSEWVKKAVGAQYDLAPTPGPYDVLHYTRGADGGVPIVSRGSHSFIKALVTPKPSRRETTERAYSDKGFQPDLNGWGYSNDPYQTCSADSDCNSGGPLERLSKTYSRKPAKFGQGRCAIGEPAVTGGSPPGYGTGYCKWTSKLDWFYRADADATMINDRVLLIVPGIDSNNEDGSAKYYAAHNGIFSADDLKVIDNLRRAGFDVAIGDWGDGDRPISQLADEVATWIDRAYARTFSATRGALGGGYYRQIQVVGVSLGGVALRDALTKPSAATSAAKVKAWFSVDAPQTGANLGRGDKGLQALVACYWDKTTPIKDRQYWSLFSRPAEEMKYESVVDPNRCSCPPMTDAEDAFCYVSTEKHDNYYAMLNARPAPAARGYAVTFGTIGFSRTTNEPNLYWFDYTELPFIRDHHWEVGRRDCWSGSSYVHQSDVAAGDSALLGLVEGKLKLHFQPTFIPVDSALKAYYAPAGACNLARFEDRGYSAIEVHPPSGPRLWVDYAANENNWPHCRVSNYLARRLENWVRVEAGLSPLTVAGYGSETSRTVPDTPACAGP